MTPRMPYTRPRVVQQALRLLECEVREADALASPAAVRDYLRLLLADRPHEVFAVVFLDAQHRVIEAVELFRGTLTQTSVYPREVVIEALARNAAAVILTRPSWSATEPSAASWCWSADDAPRRLHCGAAPWAAPHTSFNYSRKHHA